jgi:Rps23 Pro-64 3,4-dihydroxylase Tpa1-like proline 4-hydroxylase
MEFINESILENVKYETYPYPHVVIDNFLQNDKLNNILLNINNLKDNEANSIFTCPNSPYEFNKFAFSENYGDYLKQIFLELNSPKFIKYLENITGIEGLITNDINLQGAGIHRIKNGGYLQLHTDFNSYNHPSLGKLDRRINLLIYLNPDWKEEYNGSLCICDKETNTCVKKILPILNRCVIFNTSNKSIHGHPEKLNVPSNMSRQSIAVYYYTKNSNDLYDFEGDTVHNTIWYSNIRV